METETYPLRGTVRKSGLATKWCGQTVWSHFVSSCGDLNGFSGQKAVEENKSGFKNWTSSILGSIFVQTTMN